MIEIFKWSYDKLFSNGDNLFLDISQLGEERMRFSGLVRLVRQVCKIRSTFLENCYRLVIGSTVQRFKTWLLQLRTGCTSWTKTSPAPSAK